MLLHHEKIPKYQYSYIKQFYQAKIETINSVPKVAYVCWFSHRRFVPELSNERFIALQSLISNIKIPVIILTSDNYKEFDKKEDPIHDGFNYLSGNHKSDYLRAYMLHHYGGGYHDIKFRTKSWENEWEKLGDLNTWILGRRELKPSWIGHPPVINQTFGSLKQELRKNYNKLVTMGWVICRPYTPYTQDLLNRINSILYKNIDLLRLYPSPSARCCYSAYAMAPKNSYPIRWLELMGEISHPLMLKYSPHIKFGLPDIDYRSYK